MSEQAPFARWVALRGRIDSIRMSPCTDADALVQMEGVARDALDLAGQLIDPEFAGLTRRPLHLEPMTCRICGGDGQETTVCRECAARVEAEDALESEIVNVLRLFAHDLDGWRWRFDQALDDDTLHPKIEGPDISDIYNTGVARLLRITNPKGGVLHMTPAPNGEAAQLAEWLAEFVDGPCGAGRLLLESDRRNLRAAERLLRKASIASDEAIRCAFCAGYLSNGPASPFEMNAKAEVYLNAIRKPPAAPRCTVPTGEHCKGCWPDNDCCLCGAPAPASVETT